MFSCFSQNYFQENLKSWQDKYNLGTDKSKNFKSYMKKYMKCRFLSLLSSLKSKKANEEKNIAYILQLCGHPDWSTKINQLFSMHNGRNPALNDQLFEILKEGAKAEFDKVEAFLKTGWRVLSN